MKSILPLLLLLSLFACEPAETTTDTGTASEEPTAADREYYQLKVYTFADEEQVAATDTYLQNALLPGLERQGIGPIGVFKQLPSETDSSLKTYVLIPFSSIQDFLSYENKLNEDEAYLSAGSAYINATHDQAPYQRIESTLMRAFTDMPEMAATALDGPREERIYELRSYESSTEKLYWNKVDMFNAGGEIKLFDRLDFNAVFYAEVISGSKMPNLMYMTTFPDMPTRDTLWKEFFASLEWEGLKAMDKYKNNVSHADIIFLRPTGYSGY